MLTLTGHKGAVRALAYAPGPESLLATGGDDRVVRLWSPAVGQEIALLENRRDGLLSLAFSPDGKRLATGGRAGAVVVWDVDQRQRDPGSASLGGPVVAQAFTADGRALLACTRDEAEYGQSRSVFCVNLEPPHPPEALQWSGNIEHAAFDPPRDRLAIASRVRGVEVVEVGRPRGEPLFFMPSRIRAMAFSPSEGRYLAIAGGKSIGVWDLAAKTWKAECHKHKGDVLALAFSPDGLTLLSGGMDRNVRLWETLSGRQLAAWDWQVGIVNALAFSTDGMTAAVAGEKGRVVVWDIDEA